jgi:hypothetical protein
LENISNKVEEPVVTENNEPDTSSVMANNSPKEP